MKRFIESAARDQVALLPECLDDYVDADNTVRVVDVFVDELDLVGLGFERATPSLVGRPAYHPSTLLKLYIYGYLNRIQSSRRLEREARRNLELIWLTGRLTPDFKTIAEFRKDNGVAIRKVCREFVLLCRRLKLFADATVAIDGSKFKAVNNRDKNFTDRKLQARMEQLEQSIARYMDELVLCIVELAPQVCSDAGHGKNESDRYRTRATAVGGAQPNGACGGRTTREVDPDARGRRIARQHHAHTGLRLALHRALVGALS
jgi:transposase